MAKKQQGRGGGNRKKGRSTRTEAGKRRQAQLSHIIEANRVRKRLRHIKNHPNDLQTRKLLPDG